MDRGDCDVHRNDGYARWRERKRTGWMPPPSRCLAFPVLRAVPVSRPRRHGSRDTKVSGAPDTEPVPWYRVSIVWLLIAVPLTSVVMGGVLLFLAIYTYDGLVVDDYYRRGKEINRVLERDRYAEQLGLSADLVFDAPARLLRIKLHGTDGFEPPAGFKVSFMHPTRAGEDQVTQALRQGGPRYDAVLPGLSPGRWIVQIGSPTWRLVATIWMPAREMVRMQPFPTHRVPS